MRILVAGSGGREHALVWKITRSPLVKEVLVAPGNAGTASIATNVDVKAEDVGAVVRLARERKVDLVVVGPEAPLVAGLADALAAEKIPVFGPSKAAAELEGSKAFAKSFLVRRKIPTAAYGEFEKVDDAIAYVRAQRMPQVVKADGLAAGKGVFVCDDARGAEDAVKKILGEKAFGGAGARVVIEERIDGVEVSCLAFSDGSRVIPLATARDHKRAFDRDQGPNTGGMGAYSPALDVTSALEKKILETILQPSVDGMRAEGRPYRGVLYAGLMLRGSDAYVLEFNARFGDPETQPLLMRMKSDIVPALMGCARGDLGGVAIEWEARAAACVVMVAGGYPGDYGKGDVIDGLADAAKVSDCVVFHAGTAMKDGKVVTNGGRVLGVTALGETPRAAAARAYEAVAKIRWNGARWRSDIGANA